ncbi:hypothetical protein D3C76_1691270 [compost metagenome]
MVDHLAKFFNLLFGQKLALIHQHAMHGLLLMLLINHGVQLSGAIIKLCLRRQPNPRTHFANAEAVVDLRGEHQRAHTTFLIII